MTSSSHEEGVERQWAILTKEFLGDNMGRLTGLRIAEIKWGVNRKVKWDLKRYRAQRRLYPVSLPSWQSDFVGAEKGGMVDELKLEIDDRGNIKTENYMTSQEGIFAAGDIRRGQSLVVWAISEGREAARAVDTWLMGSSSLEAKDESFVHLSEEQVEKSYRSNLHPNRQVIS